MIFWDSAVQLATQSLVALSAAFGGSLGLSIIAVSLTFRGALSPWAISLKRRAADQRLRLAAMKPESDLLQKRYAKDPARLWSELKALREKHGMRTLGAGGLLLGLAQLPVFALLSAAIRQGLTLGGRFLWIRDLARPDIILLLGVVALSGVVAGTGVSTPAGMRMNLAFVSALVSAVILWKLSAGMGLYWAVSSGVTLAQTAWVRTRKPVR